MEIGRYVQQLEGYKSFIPYDFPPAEIANFDDKIIAKHSKAIRLVGKLDGITELLPDKDWFLTMSDSSLFDKFKIFTFDRATTIINKLFDKYVTPDAEHESVLKNLKNSKAVLKLSVKDIKELDKKPIVIKILNIRVDTARDLVLKLYNTTNEMVKTAQLAEMSIVYGNRYRSTYEEIDKSLMDAEIHYFKGNYKKAFDMALKSISFVDEDFKNKVKLSYEN